jgi:hypothetical protein
MNQSRLTNERVRLAKSPGPEEKPSGVGTVRFIAKCSGNSSDVLSKAKELMTIVNHNSVPRWPSEAEWRHLLPKWFVKQCSPEKSQQEAEEWLARWKSLSPEEQKKVEATNAWSLLNWLYWLEPENRQWYWWDAIVLDRNTLVIAVGTDSWPFGWGDLSWLLRAAGANQVIAEE